jgi:hypothetical protein
MAGNTLTLINDGELDVHAILDDMAGSYGNYRDNAFNPVSRVDR